ncbi:MAG: hypothetical protein ACI4JC_09965 [Faecalibacterium sp.]
MGGGHLTRPDFGMPQADPAHPLTEFYLLLQSALGREGILALPALYAAFRAPARRLYADEATNYLILSSSPAEGMDALLSAGRMQVSSSLLCSAADGAPAALLLTEECTRSSCAVQLLPPFLWEDPLPPLPDSASALSIQLTTEDLALADVAPARLGSQLVHRTKGKRWLHHPKADRYLAGRIELFQRLYR